MKWGMAEINPYTNTLNPTLSSALVCCLGGITHMQVMRTQRSVETGVRLFSSYENATNQEAEEASLLIARGACLARVIELMCVGDKRETFCPPEASVSNATRDVFGHRFDVRMVSGSTASVARAEAELDYVVRQLPVLARYPQELNDVSR